MNKGLLIGLAAAVGIGGFIMWKKKHASAPSTTPDTSSDKKEDKKDDKKATPPVNSKVGTTTPKKAPAPAQDVPYDVLSDSDYAEKKKIITDYLTNQMIPDGQGGLGAKINALAVENAKRQYAPKTNNDLYKLSLDDLKTYTDIISNKNGDGGVNDFQNAAKLKDILNKYSSIFGGAKARLAWREKMKASTAGMNKDQLSQWIKDNPMPTSAFSGVANFTGNPIYC